jgi:hypothetical protein
MRVREFQLLIFILAIAMWISACSGSGGSADPCVGECETQCKTLKSQCEGVCHELQVAQDACASQCEGRTDSAVCVETNCGMPKAAYDACLAAADCQMKFAGCLAGCYGSACEASWESEEDTFVGTNDVMIGEDTGSGTADTQDDDTFVPTSDLGVSADLSSGDVPENPGCTCDGMQCGLNGCGDSCGNCPQGKECSATFQCVAPMPACTDSGFNSVDEAAKLKTGSDGFYMHYQNLTATQPPLDALVLEIDNQGSFDGPTGPGVYDLAFTSFNQGGLWMYILYGYTQQGYSKILVPIQGTIKITQLSGSGGQFGATLQGVVMAEATLNQSTLEVNVLKNGITWCLDNVILHAPLAVTQEYCVEQGSGVFIGDNIADFSLQNCNGDWVNIHEGCGKTKALWLVLVAGW